MVFYTSIDAVIRWLEVIEMIKTVIFDLGGVYFTDGTKEAIANISEEYGLGGAAVAGVFKGEIGTAYRKGEISHEEFWIRAKEV